MMRNRIILTTFFLVMAALVAWAYVRNEPEGPECLPGVNGKVR
jgi:hypothetical protein